MSNLVALIGAVLLVVAMLAPVDTRLFLLLIAVPCLIGPPIVRFAKSKR